MGMASSGSQVSPETARALVEGWQPPATAGARSARSYSAPGNGLAQVGAGPHSVGRGKSRPGGHDGRARFREWRTRTARPTVEAYHSLDVNQWYRHGYLEPGHMFSWAWSRAGKLTASYRSHMNVESPAVQQRVHIAGHRATTAAAVRGSGVPVAGVRQNSIRSGARSSVGFAAGWSTRASETGCRFGCSGKRRRLVGDLAVRRAGPISRQGRAADVPP